MKPFRFLAVLIAVTLASEMSAQAADPGRALAGWYDLFPPSQGHFYPMYERPVVEKTKSGETTYSQTAHFDNMTNLPRSFRVTVAKNGNFKTQFGRETMTASPATAVEIGKRMAWVWDDKKQVIVPLGDDKAVIIKNDPYSEQMPLVEYAKSLDYDRIEKALGQPPRTDPTLTLKDFGKFKKGDNILGLNDWAGPAQSREQIGAKKDQRLRWTYSVEDGSKIIVNIVELKIDSITQETSKGQKIELLK